jgi:hypothetical protein
MRYELRQKEELTIETNQSDMTDRETHRLRYIDVYETLIMINCKCVAKVSRNCPVYLGIL